MEETIKRINEALDKIRPTLQADGGDVEFVKYEDNIVYVQLQGACVGCQYSTMTLQDTIEKVILAEVPGAIGVEQA